MKRILFPPGRAPIGSDCSLNTPPASSVVMFEKSVYKWDGTGDPFRMSDGQQAFGFILDLSSIRDELANDIPKMAKAA